MEHPSSFFFLLIALHSILLSQANDLADNPSLSFEQAPPKTLRLKQGESLKLVCSAFGTPPPTIKWLFNGLPMEPTGRLGNREERLLNSEDSLTTIQTATTASELSVDCPTSGIFACLASNEFFTKKANTSLGVASNPENASAEALCKLTRKRKLGGRHWQTPKVEMWTDTRLERPEAAAQLFCRASGIPKPKIRWFRVEDERELKIDDSSHYKLLPNGDLIVRDPQPVDQGGFMFRCKASNPFGEDVKDITLISVTL